MVTVAIVVSRPEALVIASMLEAGGIHVWVGAEHQASVQFYSVALGGHRICVPAWQYQEASALIREVGLPGAPVMWQGSRSAVGRLVAAWLGIHMFVGVPALIAGFIPLSVFLLLPLNVVTTLLVDPRGQNDFFLAEVV